MFVTKKYPYKPPFAHLLLAAAFFGLCGYWFFHLSMTNKRGLIIDYLIHLNTDQANIFYGSCAAICGCFVLVGLTGLFFALGEAKVVSITLDTISGPRSIFSRSNTITHFSDITNIRIQQVKSQKFVTIYARNGKRCFGRSMFENAAAFEDFLKTLMDNLRAAKTGKT